ncbi:ribokinase [Occultella aeris]|uniref:Deoxyribokinase n=1 Tax=Occultella aeris TaxID=2761496 RepID=A0A7M4DQ85_9MICO|nr:ribokinase [Occultella aeris]VZO39629.1 Ribokinase [Occultella aeris]
MNAAPRTGRGGVCVLASFMYDLVATAPRRPGPGETLIGSHFATFVGGKGFNQAVAAARAGAATTVIGRVGDDPFAAEFREFLAGEGIAAADVRTDPEHGTGVGLPVLDPAGQNSIIVIPRANLAVTVADVEAARERIESAAVLLLQLELPMDATVHAARIARAAGVRVLLNPAPAATVPTELADAVDVLIPNEGELRQLTGADAGQPVLDVARRALTGRTHALIVTLGPDGALVLEPGRPEVHVPGHRVDVVDTIGAGDAFCGSLGARLAAGDVLTEAVAFANAAAAVAVTRRGGAPSAPTRAEVLELAGAPAGT